ncbi:GumC family protein [Nostoc sp. LEGE 12450]|uniref:GumC family protein n=1 Tax=Nostoc sp. LEGE 12450 TaxID=1828643 RepID=UPI00187EAD11|nr:polysaccharide biosynthesis tyrosine autokinase [Nostoc sp. LEGE 12450]MBE8986236.1 polysaccharide biosynthesis tyrosine autokinase [Nostoc sp. LEGE 12450]
MENYPSQPSSSDSSNNSVPPSLQNQQNQIVPWIEEEEESSVQKLLSALRRRALVMTGVTITVMTIAVISLVLKQKPPEYEGNFQLLVEPVNDDSKAVDVVKDSNPQISSLDYESQIQVLKSPEVMRDTLKQLQASYPELNYYSLLDSLKITRLGETKIILVSYRSNNQDQTQAVLQRLAKDYLDYSKIRRQTKLRQGLQFVEYQLPLTQNRVDQLQKELQFFRQNYNFDNPESQAEQISSQIIELSQKRQEIDLQLAQARANLTSLKEKNGATAMLNNAPLYQQLITQIRQFDIQIATESTRLEDKNPTIQTLKEKRASLLPLLRKQAQQLLGVKFAEVEMQLQQLEVQSQELTKIEQKLAQRRNQLPILTRQYTELQRKLQFANESLNRFLSTRENLQIQISQTELGWQLLQVPTTPDIPISSSDTLRSFLLALVAGIISGVGIVLLMEKLDNAYQTVDDLKRKVKQPLLGNIPFEQQIQTKQNHTFKQVFSLLRIPNFLSKETAKVSVLPEEEQVEYSSNFSEALRVVYTNIKLLSSDSPLRSIVISSAMPGDGKSTIALHLAQIATAMGQRVLLVDADLRKPTIHNLSHLNNLWGLSNLISTNLPVGEVIRQLPSMSQLSVITAGPVPSDPAKLLSSSKMKQLMIDFQKTFDLVIYDAPPLVGLADASLIAPHTDGLLIVVRIHKTNSSILKIALDNLKIYRLNILGIVCNGQKTNFNGLY